MSSRVTRHSGGIDVDSDSKWDATDSPRSLRGRGQKDDFKQQAALQRSTREKVQQELQAAKGKINKAERIVAEAEPEQEPIDDVSEEGDEDEGAEELGSQLHDVTAALRSRASQAKSTVRQKASQLKQKGAALARDAQDTASKLQAPKSLRDGVESAKRTIRRKKAEFEGTQDDDEGEADDAEDDEEGSAPAASDWQSSLYAKGTSLMHSATDAAASLRSRIAEAAPGLQSKASNVLRSARKQLDNIDFADGEQQAEDDDEEEGEEQDRSESEGEEGEESLVTRLRSRAPSAEAVTSQAKSALGRGKEALGRGKEMLDSTLRSEPLKQAKQKGQQFVDQARSAGEKIVNKARSTVAEFDWDQPKAQAQSALRDAKTKTTQGVRNLRQKGEELVDDAQRSFNRDEEDDSEAEEEQPDEQDNEQGSSTLDRSKASLRRFGDAVGSQASQLKSRARDALDEAEEDLGMKSPSSPSLQSNDASRSDAAFNRAAARGLNKFDRVVAKDGNMKMPLAVIGTIFLLWLGASIYNFVAPVEPEPVVPANMFEAARMAAHDLKVTGLGHLHNLESRTHDLVDSLTGRPKPLSWSEKTWNWITSPFARVHTDRLDAAHARDAIRNARSELEDRGAELKNNLEGSADWAQDKIDRARAYTEHKIIPTARDGLHHAAETARINAQDLEYKRAHLGDYINTAKESAQNLKNMAQHKGEDLNLLPKQSLSSRVWAWVTGADTETYPQKAQRYANEAADKVQSGIEFARDAMPHERTLGERIRSHLPGHKLTPAEQVEAYLSKIQRNIPNLDPSGTARDYYDRALAAGWELRDDAYAKVQELTKPSLMDRLKAWIPGAHHASLAERIQRNVPNLDVSGTAQEYYERARAAGYELKDGVYEKVHDVVKPSIGDRIRSVLPGGHDPMLEKVLRNVPDVDPRGTAQDYYARAKAAGYEVRDGMYQRAHDFTHPTLMDRLREWIPGAHHASLADRIERNIPNLDARGTAQRARAAGYDLKDGAYTKMHDLTHPSLGDRIKAHLPGMHQRTIPNIDIRGTAQEYADRARAAGYELRNGAYQLMDRAQNQHPMHTTTNLDPADDIRLRGANLHMHDAVPLRDIRADMAHAQPPPDPLAHRESVIDKMKHAVEDGVNSIKSHLPGRAAPVQPVVVETPRSTLGAQAEALKDDIRARVAGAESTVRTGLQDAEARVRSGVDSAQAHVRADLHQARKGAEYVGHRVVHNAEAAGHRVEEKYKEVKDKVEYRLP